MPNDGVGGLACNPMRLQLYTATGTEAWTAGVDLRFTRASDVVGLRRRLKIATGKDLVSSTLVSVDLY